MPRLLKIIIFIEGVQLLLGFGSLLFMAFQTGNNGAARAIMVVVGLAIRLLLIHGLIQRSKLAWTGARILSLLVVTLYCLIIGLQALISPLAGVVTAAMYTIPLALDLTVFFALGRPSVRGEFFRRPRRAKHSGHRTARRRR